MTTTFVGRNAELVTIEERLGSARLVTLLGMGGVGKSRLVREFAARRGVQKFVFCDLSAAQTDEDVCSAVGAALQVGLNVVGPLAGRVEALGKALAVRVAESECILVLDAVERVAAELAPVVERWLTTAGQARILVTSRVRLGAAGEHVVSVDPLPIAGADADETTLSDAERLFMQRAQAAGATLGADDTSTVRALVRALDGIPLAIELTAACARVLPAKTLLTRVQEGQDLALNAEDVTRRHGTMRNVVAGSWDLLDPEAREALLACACFRGGFAAESAEAVIAGKSSELLTRLIDASLVRAIPTRDGVARLDVFHTVRSYASERSHEQAELERALFSRHAAHMAAAARAWREAAPRTGGAAYLGRLARDHDNLVVALTRLVEHAQTGPLRADDARVLLSLAVELEPIRGLRGHMSTYLGWLRAALGAASSEEVALRDLRLRAVLCEGRALAELGMVAESRAAFERARDLAAAAGDGPAEGHARAGLARLNANAGEWRAAVTEFAAVKVCAIRAKDDGLLHLALAGQAFHGSELRDGEESRASIERATNYFREAGAERESLFWLVQVARHYNDYNRTDRAHERLMEALSRARAIGDRRSEGFAYFGLGGVQLSRDELDQAAVSYKDAAEILAEVGNERYRGYALGYLGVAEQLRNRFEEAETAYLASCAALSTVGDEPNVALFELFRAGMAAERDRAAESATLLEEASANATRWAGSGMRVVVAEMVTALLEMSRARAALAHNDMDTAAKHLRNAERRLQVAEEMPEEIESASEVYDWRDVAFDVRLAYRLGKRSLAGFPALRLPPQSVLVMGECLRIRPAGDGNWIDFGRRPLLRRLLSSLVALRLDAPGKVLDAAALIDAGWHDEPMTDRAAANRLHVALGTMRQMGLRGILERADGGWRLRTDIPLLRVAEGEGEPQQ